MASLDDVDSSSAASKTVVEERGHHIDACKHLDVDVYLYTCVCMYVCMYVCTRICIYLCMYVRMYMCICAISLDH